MLVQFLSVILFQEQPHKKETCQRNYQKNVTIRQFTALLESGFFVSFIKIVPVILSVVKRQ